ncbi:MAG TPA: queuosine precursor transporter [Candidatus Paceibacterota bacterium]|nr:queuosine precursor transporter [Candidatus Paceibacterota bacterium]HPT40108.1 queuosine precursor transporter [Candidatus Paceibacterota bacterium]
MSILLLIAWIIGVTSFTLLGSWYARKYNRSDLLIGLYVTFILVAQILATKVAEFNLGFKTFTGPAGIIIFSVTFLLTDIVNEKFGRKETHKMIGIAFISQVAMIFFFWIGTKLPAASYWTLQKSWEQIFGLVPRITLASWIAFLISENADAYIFSWFKKITKGKHLWMRNIFSTIPALLIDSLIFIPLAFLGVMPILPLIIGQTAVKWLIGIINIPFMYLNRAILEKNK